MKTRKSDKLKSKFIGCGRLAAALPVILVGLALAQAPAAMAKPLVTSAAVDEQSGGLDSALRAKLDKSQFKNITVQVDANGIATLSGSVDLVEYKMDADRRAHGVKGVTAVRNEIQVAGPSVPDAVLQEKLLGKLEYDRVGYGNLFNAISISVRDGVVTLGGHARTYEDRDSAVGLVSTYPGVKDLVVDTEVDPTSPMDDQTRIAVARAVYGFPSLNKYAIDPGKPIRISVQNGHVELYGTVDNEADKDAAYIRANSVPNVFSVTNHLQVAGQAGESSK